MPASAPMSCAVPRAQALQFRIGGSASVLVEQAFV